MYKNIKKGKETLTRDRRIDYTTTRITTISSLLGSENQKIKFITTKQKKIQITALMDNHEHLFFKRGN